MDDLIKEFYKHGILGAMLVALGLYHALRERRWDKLIDKIIELAEKTGIVREAVDDLREQTGELKRERQFQQKVLHRFYQSHQPKDDSDEDESTSSSWFGLGLKKHE